MKLPTTTQCPVGRRLSILVMSFLCALATGFSAEAGKPIRRFDEIRVRGEMRENGDFFQLSVDSGGRVVFGLIGDARSEKVHRTQISPALCVDLWEGVAEGLQSFQESTPQVGPVASTPVAVTIRRGLVSLEMRFFASTYPSGIPGKLGAALQRVNAMLPADQRMP